MAGRKPEPGISYYRMNCGHTSNKKVRLLFNEFDANGYWIWQCIIDHAYSYKGYYFDCSNNDEMELFATDVCKKQVSLVNEVIRGCIKRGLFDECVFNMFGILSSVMMQEFYLDATSERRRKGTEIEIFEELLLIEIPPDSVNISIVPWKKSILPRKNGNVPRSNATKKSKVEESKEDESRVEHAREAPPPGFLQNIFSELKIPPGFYSIWLKWKNYKASRFQFNFKTEESERAALSVLANLSGKNESTAAAIIQQSIANEWKGLFELKRSFSGSTSQSNSHQVDILAKDLNYLYESYLEDRCTIASIEHHHFDYLSNKLKINLSEKERDKIARTTSEHFKAKNETPDENEFNAHAKCFAVLHVFEKLKAGNKKKIF